MPSQITDFLATQADGGGDYDWSDLANWIKMASLRMGTKQLWTPPIRPASTISRV